jgi:N-acetylglutamate synthase-like GNAT family acetyltransferase
MVTSPGTFAAESSPAVVPVGIGCADALLRSERSYFQLGAEAQTWAGGTTCRMPRCTRLAAGWVAWFDTPTRGPDEARQRVARLTAHAAADGALRCRLYDYSHCPHVIGALHAAGFRQSTEVGLVADRPDPRNLPPVSLRRVRSTLDWADKLGVHASERRGPDGHEAAPDAWVRMERAKSASGALEFYLAESEGRVCGTVGLLPEGRLLRMKNLVVDASMRGRGIGTAITARTVNEALRRDFMALGLLALEDGDALSMYRKSGFIEVARVVEWVKWMT